MGAKQSKRSVDISGKEAEGAGEVAAAGAGGEGRVEQLADADALKPQLNGDAHIHETTEKEKNLDSGTPENEKDATTEKESKEQEDENKEAVPITNGEAEQKVENGESTPSPEDGKKPKKEKVKKKWSLRSISFSRKDKPKQEKKQKDDESKTNGEPEKVPEESAEQSPESEKNNIVPEETVEAEAKDEKTPETPVTEPITNGSITPESPKEEALIPDEAVANNKENDRTETPKADVESETLPVANGLPADEPKSETPEPAAPAVEASEPEEAVGEPAEPAPAPVTTATTATTEITVEKEVCAEQMPLLEPTPPPLPANPPPSSVASFAATTMAPEPAPPAPAPPAPPSPPPADVETVVHDAGAASENVASEDLVNDANPETDETTVDMDSEKQTIALVAAHEPKESEQEDNDKKTEIEKNDVSDETTTDAAKVSIDISKLTNGVPEMDDLINETEKLENGTDDDREESAVVTNGDAQQEPVPVPDKLAELIPEIPSVPELNNELAAAAAGGD